MPVAIVGFRSLSISHIATQASIKQQVTDFRRDTRFEISQIDRKGSHTIFFVIGTKGNVVSPRQFIGESPKIKLALPL